MVNVDKVGEAYRVPDLIAPYSSILIHDEAGRMSYFLQYNALLLDLLGASCCADPKALFEAFNSRKTHWSLKPGARETLSCLKDWGLAVGLLSNFDSHLSEVLENLATAELIDHLHVSQSLGLEKPDPAFYTSFLDSRALRVEDVAYVGDNYLLDYAPARRLGIWTFLLDEIGAYSHLCDSINRLSDLPDNRLARLSQAIV